MVWPASVKVITPPNTHVNMELLLSVGIFASSTVGAPGTHGAGVEGVQGIGVSTPSAAAVAAATAGLAGEVHIAKGRIFTKGILSMMLASGVWVSTALVGNTTSELGAVPKLHVMDAPIQHCKAMAMPPSLGLVFYEIGGARGR